jgi:hypothetical protein
MKNKELLIVGAGAAALWAAGKYRAFQSTEFGVGLPRGFQYQAPTTLTFDLPITAFNGSRTPLNIGSVDLRVAAEGQYLGRAFSATQQQVAAAGQSVLNTKVILNLIDMIAAIPGFAGGVKDQAVSLRFYGTINVEGFYANVDIPYTFNLPKFK